MLHNDQLHDMRQYPAPLKRLIFRRFKIDLDDPKAGFQGQPLASMDEHHEEMLSFAATVYNAQQAKVDRLQGATTDFLTALEQLKAVSNE